MGMIVEIGDPQCQALSLSDSKRCLAQATAYNNLFCAYHAKLCFGLYMGYKRRNARLDKLGVDGPAFLTNNSSIPPANLSFKNLKDPAELHEIQEHLFDQYVLLGQVIAARQLHHKHFFSLEMDYGHKVYLEKLQARHTGTLRALERIGQRISAVLYEKEQWYKWVKATQAEEEATREKEQKKVKLEAAMLRCLKIKEDEQRQSAYLDEVWRERMAAANEEEGGDEDWDPIEDILAEDREKYLDLIRQFLWFEPAETNDDAVQQDHQQQQHGPQTKEIDGPAPQMQVMEATVADEDEEEEAEGTPSKVKKSKTKSKGKKKKGKKPAAATTSVPQPSGQLTASKAAVPAHKPASQLTAYTAPINQLEVGKGHIESPEEVRRRLREGVERDHSGLSGPQLLGTIQNPVETHGRTAPLPEEEIEKLVLDITEINALLLCRMLLSHATLLPAALRAKSVEEFIADPSISHTDLRDLCLKVEQPKLQELRDACADFARGDNPDPPPPEEEVEVLSTEEVLRRNLMYGDMNGMGLFAMLMSSTSKKLMAAEDPGNQEKRPKDKRMKITVCGKTIWNHASEAAMARDGWLQFSVMAKDCSFEDAVSLCRNWDEFYELQSLVLWQFFPSAKWASWTQNALTGQLLHLGFIPFQTLFMADILSRHDQVGSKGRHRRQHHIEECRNLICAHMKRGDPVTNRFIDYCIMQAGTLQILVRDGKTKQILYAPNEENARWIHRVKSGLGRASKNEYIVTSAVDSKMLEALDHGRDWRFGFDAHYELYIWDFVPGESSMVLFHHLVDMLRRARRMQEFRDLYGHQKHVLEHLTQDADTMRVRQIRPGEEAPNIYDFVTGPTAQYAIQNNKCGVKWTEKPLELVENGAAPSPYTLYNDADVAEDEVLFGGGRDQGLFTPIINPLVVMENSGMTQTMLQYGASLIDELDANDVGEDGVDATAGKTKALMSAKEDSNARHFIHSMPPIWRHAYFEINRKLGEHGRDREDLLDRLDFFSQKLEMSGRELQKLSQLELMERDRSYSFKESFHLGDLEPGARDKYVESMRIIIGLQKASSVKTAGTEWAWFCLDILDRLGLQAWCDDYDPNPHSPWPHRYLAQDVTQAFVTMGLFFPKLEVTKLVRDFLDSEQGSQFKISGIFDPVARSRMIPDRRSRTSQTRRPKSFFKELEELESREESMVDICPMSWSTAVRPIIATLYRAGIIQPSNTQPHPDCVPGRAYAAEEPHRPGKLDFFVRYKRHQPLSVPPVPSMEDWPDLLESAQAFSKENPGAKFSLLRLWSAPHFYPMMVHYDTRHVMAFVDSRDRSWEFKLLPKDLEESEKRAMHLTSSRMGVVVEAAREHDGVDLSGHFVPRGDAILVMAESEEELLRLSTIATFAMQTKPWLREVDLWKSFVNVELDFLQGLDPSWLD
ncbi:hypothetical protein KVR01_007818 [Diaporthe batatas]|uniref:uncharacterized protein n=1 Tax=Diaporthe batatas TaxID=748121 RepID=UPI001D057AC9|nr:uncharacterized protein KVR01_007818 [Diaporthe batatas]KAG8162053.1 hypothetical protein KVR01_007818 [Diaporthe batatas]